LRFGSLGFRDGRSLLPPQAAEQVDLPARADPRVVVHLASRVAREVTADRTDGTEQRLVDRRYLAGCIHRRKQGGARSTRRGPGLLDAGDGGREAQVLCEHAVDDLDQDRVIEAEPPAVQRWRSRLLCSRSCRYRIVEGMQIGGRCFVVGADLAPGEGEQDEARSGPSRGGQLRAGRDRAAGRAATHALLRVRRQATTPAPRR